MSESIMCEHCGRSIYFDERLRYWVHVSSVRLKPHSAEPRAGRAGGTDG